MTRELENAGVTTEQIEQWALGAAQLALGDFSMTQEQREAAADSIAALYGYGLEGRPTGEEGIIEVPVRETGDALTMMHHQLHTIIRIVTTFAFPRGESGQYRPASSDVRSGSDGNRDGAVWRWLYSCRARQLGRQWRRNEGTGLKSRPHQGQVTRACSWVRFVIAPSEHQRPA